MRLISSASERESHVQEWSARLALSWERCRDKWQEPAPPPRSLGSIYLFAQKMTKLREKPPTANSEAQKALNALSADFVEAVLSKDDEVHVKLTKLADGILELDSVHDSSSHAECNLMPQVVQLLITYLDQWKDEVTTEAILGGDRLLLPGAISWIFSWTVVVEYLSRASSSKMSQAASHTLASATEGVVRAILNNLRSQSQNLQRSQSRSNLDTSADIDLAGIDRLCDWFVLCCKCVPKTLTALEHFSGIEVMVAFEAIRALSALDAPFGYSMDALNVQQTALKVIEKTTLETTVIIGSELGRQCLALMSASGLMPWEDLDLSGETNIDEIVQITGSLKRSMLELCGAVAAFEEYLASAVAKKATHMTRIMQALSAYEQLPGGQEILLKNYVTGVAAFCWREASDITSDNTLRRRGSSTLMRRSSSLRSYDSSESIPVEDAKPGEACKKLLTAAISTLKKGRSFKYLIQAIHGLVEEATPPAIEAFFEHSDAIEKFISVSIANPEYRYSLLTDTLALIDLASAKVNGLKLPFCLELLQIVNHLADAVADTKSLLAVTTMLVNLVCSLLDDQIETVLDSDALSSLARATGTMSKLVEESDAKNVDSTTSKKVQDELLVLIGALLSRASVATAATRGDDDCHALASLLKFPKIVGHAADFITLIICEVDPKLAKAFQGEDRSGKGSGAEAGRAGSKVNAWVSPKGSNLTSPSISASTDVSLTPGQHILNSSHMKPSPAPGLTLSSAMEPDDQLPQELFDLLIRKQVLLDSLLATLLNARVIETKISILDSLRVITSSDSLLRLPRLAYRIGLRDKIIFNAVTDTLAKGSADCAANELFLALALTTLRVLDSLLRQPGIRKAQFHVAEGGQLLSGIGQVLEKRANALSVDVFDALFALASEEDSVTVDRCISSESSDRKIPQVLHPVVITIIFKIARAVQPKIRKSVVRALKVLCASGPHCRYSFSKASAVEIILQWMSETEEPNELRQLGEILGLIVEFSANPHETDQIFAKITSLRESEHALLSVLLENLELALQRELDPRSMFSLSGRRSGLLSNNCLQNFPPGRGGYTLFTWFRAEDLSPSRPILSLFDHVGYALEILCVDGDLLLRTRSGSKETGSPESICRLSDCFSLGKWTHVALSHAASSLFSRSSDVSIYLDGKVIWSDTMKYPRFSSSSASVAVGLSAISPAISSFCGQFGAFYVFSENLKKEAIESLYLLGPQHDSELLQCDPSFFYPATSKSSNVGDFKLSEKLLLLLAPRASDERACPDNSFPAASGFKHTFVAKMMGSDANVKVLQSHNIRIGIQAIGGLWSILQVFSNLQRIHLSPSAENGEISSLEMSLRLLIAFLRNDIQHQVNAVRAEVFPLSALFAERCSPDFLTIGLIEALLSGVNELSYHSYIVKEIGKSWLFNFRIWSRASSEVQIFLLEKIADMLRVDAVGDQVARLICGTVPVSVLVDIADSSPSDEVRKIAVFVALRAVIAKHEAMEKSSEQESRMLFHLLDSVNSVEEKRRSAARVLLTLFQDLSVDQQKKLIRTLGKFSDGALSAAISAFQCNDELLQESAVYLACTIVKEMESEEAERKLVVSLYESLSKREIDASTHSLLLRVSFGEIVDGILLPGIEDAVPLIFYKIWEDKDPVSLITALRALLNQLEGSSANVDVLICRPMWPKWISMTLLPMESGDENLRAAIQKTVEGIVNCLGRQMLQHAGAKAFSKMLNRILACDDLNFIVLALEKLMHLILDTLVPMTTRQVKGEMELIKIDYLEKFALAVLAVDLLVENSGTQNKSLLSLVSITIDSMRLARVWLIASQPAKDQSMIQRNFSGSTSMSKLSAHNSEVERSDPTALLSASIDLPGSFLRSTLRLLSWAVFSDDVNIQNDKMMQTLLAAAVPTGSAVIPEMYLYYVKLVLEQWCSTARNEGRLERAQKGEQLWDLLNLKWRERPQPRPQRRTGAESVSPELRAAELLKEETTWRLKCKAETADVSANSERTFHEFLEKLVKATDDHRAIRKERMERRAQFINSRKESVQSVLDARTRALQYTWQKMGEFNRLERYGTEMLSVADSSESRKLFWTLDQYEDSAGRRWLLRMDPSGSDHSDAAVSLREAVVSATTDIEELRLVSSSSHELVPKDLIDRLNQNIAEDEEDEDEEHRKEKGHEDSLLESGGSSLTGQQATGVEAPDNIQQSGFKEFMADTANLAAASATTGSVLSSSPCTLIQPLVQSAGTIQLTVEGLTFRPSPKEDMSDLEVDIVHSEKKITFSEIEEVHLRRYLLQPCALEIFLSSKEAYFFVLPNATGCHSLLKTLDVHLKRLGRGAKVIRSSKARQQALKDAQHQWKRRQITNFEYLMILNKLAGRSYNDISQYPVFPWVLADYTSHVLDLSNPRTFRDFSKPMGCQCTEDEDREAVGSREQYFRNRYESWEDPRGVPKFHYGSHYSSSGIVLHFLLRMEPYTSLFLELQGGYFDVPDRLFSSVNGAWTSASTSLQAVNEVVPELFYNPMILRNNNSLPLGTRQDGKTLGDVELPPWAKGSPELFVRLHSEALESPYVSANLDLWIDLIFGYKQRGPSAVEACNVFYYLTYEGAIDMENLSEDLKQSVVQQIAHFGQTPIQLLRKSHPSRDMETSSSSRHIRRLTATFDSMESSDSHDPIIWIHQMSDNLMAIGRSRNLAVHKFLPLPDLYGNPFTFESDVRIVGGELSSQGKRSRGRRVGGAHFAPGFTEGNLSNLFAITHDTRVVLSGGHWDSSIRCCLTSSAGKPRQILRGHRDVVLCLSLSDDDRTLVSGSRDTTVMVWEVDPEFDFDRDRNKRSDFIYEFPRLTLYGHQSGVRCVAVNRQIGCIASGDVNGLLLLHSMRDGRVLRVMQPTYMATRLVITNLGSIVSYSAGQREISVKTVNDIMTGKVDVKSEVSAMCLTRDGKILVCGDTGGEVTIYSAWNLAVLERQAPCPGVLITAVTLDYQSDSVVLLGLRDGRIAALSLDMSSLKEAALGQAPNIN